MAPSPSAASGSGSGSGGNDDDAAKSRHRGFRFGRKRLGRRAVAAERGARERVAVGRGGRERAAAAREAAGGVRRPPGRRGGGTAGAAGSGGTRSSRARVCYVGAADGRENLSSSREKIRTDVAPRRSRSTLSSTQRRHRPATASEPDAPTRPRARPNRRRRIRFGLRRSSAHRSVGAQTRPHARSLAAPPRRSRRADARISARYFRADDDDDGADARNRAAPERVARARRARPARGVDARADRVVPRSRRAVVRSMPRVEAAVVLREEGRVLRTVGVALRREIVARVDVPVVVRGHDQRPERAARKQR